MLALHKRPLRELSKYITLISLLTGILACQLPQFPTKPLPLTSTDTVTRVASTATPTRPASAARRESSPSPTAPQILPPPWPQDKERYDKIFLNVWRTVNRRYVYPDFNGTDWEAVRREFEPLVASVADDESFWNLMQEMVSRLNDDHSAFLNPDEVEEEDTAMRGQLDYVGIGVYVTVPEDATYGVVLFPMPGGPAEAAGVRAHDRILEIDGRQVCCDEEGFDILDALLGPVGTTINLLVAYPGESARQVQVERARIQSQLPIPSRIVTSTLCTDQSTGYILVPTLWDETIGERTREILHGLLEPSMISGLVIDMRINGGGAFTELYDLLSLFTEGEVGTFMRRGKGSEVLTIIANPVTNSQDIPMVVLVGHNTESYAEVFSGVLQTQGRAIVVGEVTAGNVETVFPYDFNDGSRLWLAEETFIVPGMPSWEDTGVQPDIHVTGRWEDITAETDRALQKAVEILLCDE